MPDDSLTRRTIELHQALEQAVSFAWGNLALSYPDGKCPLTKDDVRRVACALYGFPRPPEVDGD